ncbi:hypothetical protein [Flavobacterium humidisoli]|uniref:DUF502 domain-containing protein n=1 Tax=Flavobacterium humidisoli TaxID=2937442 RepID=A0ABY4M1F3_9FLAO|nr:hypothetical protein [Flavobacterium humidisoli]UPZ17836.1 hypothetical protein M0M44_10910 [Flavobacterium humidisoli]
MKSITRFIINTLTGGILFLIPLVFLIILFNTVNKYIVKISGPLANLLPDRFLGLDGSRLLAVVLLAIFCFLGGLVIRTSFIANFISRLEVAVFCYLPGYSMIKAIASDAVGARVSHKAVAVFVKDRGNWSLGFLIEENKEFCAVFFPEAPKHDSGEVRIVPIQTVQKIEVPTHKIAQSFKNYGRGTLNWLEKAKEIN